MPIKILCASHISHSIKIKSLQQAVDSINNQTLLPDLILIGLSIDEKIQFPKINSKVKLEIKYSEKKLYQFEHYKILFEEIQDDDLVMFIDDDDLYYPDRVKIVNFYFKQGYDLIKSGIGVIGDRSCNCLLHLIKKYQKSPEILFLEGISEVHKPSEYVSKAYKGKLIRKFDYSVWDYTDENRCKIFDLVFTCSVIPGKGIRYIDLPVITYLYRVYCKSVVSYSSVHRNVSVDS